MKNSVNLGGFTVAKWKEKRSLLKSNLSYSADWEEAIGWYNQRLQLRYFGPMKRIEGSADGEGFSLVTIHCALIEHLASITAGRLHNHQKNKSSPNYEYNSSIQHFTNFLETSAIFSKYFAKTEDSTSDFCASDFYANVRCALLHDACTKNNWRINTLSCGYNNPNGELMIVEPSGIKRLFRDVLTEKLSTFFDNYKDEMKGCAQKRLYFARKMDHLCEITADDSPWWRIDDV